MPGRVVVPAVGLEERVLVLGARLDVTPIAVEDVLAGVDERPGVGHRLGVDGVGGHDRDLPAIAAVQYAVARPLYRLIERS